MLVATPTNGEKKSDYIELYRWYVTDMYYLNRLSDDELTRTLKTKKMIAIVHTFDH